MSVLTENKTVSGTASLVASCFAFYYYISRFPFVSIFAFITLPDNFLYTDNAVLLFWTCLLQKIFF